METAEQKIAAILRAEDGDKEDLINNPAVKIENVHYRLIKHYVCSIRPETSVLEECEAFNDLEADGFEVETAYLTHDGKLKTGKAFQVTRTVDILDDETAKRALESE